MRGPHLQTEYNFAADDRDLKLSTVPAYGYLIQRYDTNSPNSNHKKTKSVTKPTTIKPTKKSHKNQFE